MDTTSNKITATSEGFTINLHFNDTHKELFNYGFKPEHHLYLAETVLTNDLLNSLRLLNLSEKELYFLSPKTKVFSATPHTEMLALHALRKLLVSPISSYSSALHEKILSKATLELSELCSRYVKNNPLLAERPQELTDSINANFISWTHELGLNIDRKFRLGNFPSTGRGLYSTQEIPEDQLVFKIPRHFILNVDSALSSTWMGDILKQLKEELNLDDDTLFLLFLISEKNNKESVWRLYFDLLPETVHSGLDFSAVELSELQSDEFCDFLDHVIKIKENLGEYYDKLFPDLSLRFPKYFPPSIYTFESFLSIRLIVDSRGFYIKIGGKEKNCLLPLVDCCNFAFYSQLSSRGYFDEDSQEYTVKSLTKINPGEQIFLNYGPFSNTSLLLHYGFVLENNPYDQIAIRIEPPSQPIQQKQLDLLERFNIGFDHCTSLIHPIPYRLVNFLRILSMDEIELERDYSSIDHMDFVSDRNESEVYVILRNVFICLLQSNEDYLSCTEDWSECVKLARLHVRCTANILQNALQSLPQEKD